MPSQKRKAEARWSTGPLSLRARAGGRAGGRADGAARVGGRMGGGGGARRGTISAAGGAHASQSQCQNQSSPPPAPNAPAVRPVLERVEAARGAQPVERRHVRVEVVRVVRVARVLAGRRPLVGRRQPRQPEGIRLALVVDGVEHVDAQQQRRQLGVLRRVGARGRREERAEEVREHLAEAAHGARGAPHGVDARHLDREAQVGRGHSVARRPARERRPLRRVAPEDGEPRLQPRVVARRERREVQQVLRRPAAAVEAAVEAESQ